MAEASDELMQELQEVAQVLYPNSRPRAVWREANGPSEVGFRAVPSAARPRLIARAESSAGAGVSAALASYSTALSAKQRTTRVVGAGVANGLWATGRVGVPWAITLGAPDAESLEDHISVMVGRPVHLMVGIGTRRANRKPVILVTDRAGERLLYLKVGHNPVTTQLVEGEMHRLALVRRGDLRTVSAPVVMDFHVWSGLALLALSCLPTSMWDMRPERAPLRQMREVACGFTGLGPPAEPYKIRAGVDRAIAVLSNCDPVTSERLSLARDSCKELLSAPAATGHAWHGDWTPWNMSRSGGRLRLWDWERFDVGLPFGMDSLHYFVNLRTYVGGFTAAQIRRGLDEGCEALGHQGKAAADLQILYLLMLASRYAASLAEDGGEIIRPKSETLVGEIERRVGAGRGGRERW